MITRMFHAHKLSLSHFRLVQGERATGYGVSLLNVLFGAHSESALLRSTAPSNDVKPVDMPTPKRKKH